MAVIVVAPGFIFRTTGQASSPGRQPSASATAEQARIAMENAASTVTRIICSLLVSGMVSGNLDQCIADQIHECAGDKRPGDRDRIPGRNRRVEPATLPAGGAP